MSRFHVLRLFALSATLVLFTAACSQSSESDEGDGVATLEDTSGSGIGDTAAAETLTDAAEEVDPEEAALAFSECMRNEGVDFPDVGVDADGRLDLRAGFAEIDRGSDGFQAAIELCRPIIESAGFGGGNRAAIGENVEIQDALLEFSECVREGGYDVGDLALGGPGPGAAGGANNGANAGEGAAPQRGQGEGQGAFGNRSARFASQLGLDYEDPDVAATIDGCTPVLDEAFAAAGLGQGR